MLPYCRYLLQDWSDVVVCGEWEGWRWIAELWRCGPWREDAAWGAQQESCHCGRGIEGKLRKGGEGHGSTAASELSTPMRLKIVYDLTSDVITIHNMKSGYIRSINYIYHIHQLYISDTSAMISDPSTIYIRPINYVYQTHQLYISDQSTICIRPINYISDQSTICIRPINYIYHSSTIYIRPINYISDPSTICIRPTNYIYQIHQLHISDPSTMISDPSTIYIRPIN